MTKQNSSPIRRVGTTINATLQNRADNIICKASTMASVQIASIIVIDNDSGQLLAESSWKNGKKMEFSPALEGYIQPGSTFKTFALVAAIEQGYGLDTNLLSAPFCSTHIKGVDGDPWTVRNYGHVYRGDISLRRAFIVSDNCAFARLVEMLDYEQFLSVYRRFGLLDKSERGYPSIVLGGTDKGVNMINLALAYQSFANNGLLQVAPILIRYLQFYDDSLLWHLSHYRDACSVMTSETASIIRSALRDAACSYGLPHLYAKSGTTSASKLIAAVSKKMTSILCYHRKYLDGDLESNKNVPTLYCILDKILS